MLQPLPLSASECHHSGKGSRSVRHGEPRHRREVNARALASPLPFGDHRTSVWSPKKRPRELDRHTTRSPPTARWSTSAWPSSSPGLHSRGRSPRTRVVDRLGSRSSWLWTLFTRTHRLIDAERRPPPRSETGVAQRPAAEWIAQCEQEHTKPGHVPTRVCPSAVRAGHGLSSFTVLRNWIAPIPPGNSARGVTQYPCRREVM